MHKWGMHKLLSDHFLCTNTIYRGLRTRAVATILYNIDRFYSHLDSALYGQSRTELRHQGLIQENVTMQHVQCMQMHSV